MVSILAVWEGEKEELEDELLRWMGSRMTSGIIILLAINFIIAFVFSSDSNNHCLLNTLCIFYVFELCSLCISHLL